MTLKELRTKLTSTNCYEFDALEFHHMEGGQITYYGYAGYNGPMFYLNMEDQNWHFERWFFTEDFRHSAKARISFDMVTWADL